MEENHQVDPSFKIQVKEPLSFFQRIEALLNKFDERIQSFLEEAHNRENTSKSMKLMGNLFVKAFYLIYAANIYMLVFFAIPFMIQRPTNSLSFSLSYSLALFTCIGASIQFQRKAQTTSPGTPEKAQIITQKDRPSIPESIQHEQQTTFRGLSEFSGLPKCEKCLTKPIKPVRTHHCRSCMMDVMVMDHHCPWINNCVGLMNHGYFVLFITYLFLATTLAIYPFSITELEETKRLPFTKDQFGFNTRSPTVNEFLLTFCLYSNFVLSLLLFGFSIWNWYLTVKGLTTVEYMSVNYTRRSHNRVQGLDYVGFDDWRANLYLRFGTVNVMEIMRPFCEKKPPVNGLEWTMICLDQPNHQADEESGSLISNRVTTFDGVIEL